MSGAKIYREQKIIPTYLVGEEEKNPMFFEKRVYQGSTGKVYPNPVIEKICNEKVDKSYDAIILENDYLYVILLPELGGRIYTAYDKTNNYDFVYHNRVIKPALVGLLGPWISGGIEFNWPQHHRPSTYKPVNSKIEVNADGSVSAYLGEIENMFGLKGMTEIKLYEDKAYIEINAQIYNRSDLPQTFLWWANPAFKVNDDTKTIMPPDVTAVMDHGKRAVSTFPIATGEYYKMDYSKGVDISRYKNIPVPTSFMAYKSNFDFVGGYDYAKQAGLYHTADHQISPGKKQWTWGNGDFGTAWDRNLTDADGPYVELMTGCFTDNQPDFTFIAPQEEKCFTQYFMPYKNVGDIKNANKDFCFNLENNLLTVYSTGKHENVHITATLEGRIIYDKVHDFAPGSCFSVADIDDNAVIKIDCACGSLTYDKTKIEAFGQPKQAVACPIPQECKTNEELYLCGLHIEQYRHATRLAEDYYREGLARDGSDMRLNGAYGLLLLRRGQFAASIPYFEKAIEKAAMKNPNPASTEPYFHLGIALMYLQKPDAAYDNFYKCVWSNENKTQAYYYLAVIEVIRGNLGRALAFVDSSLQFNCRNMKSNNLKGRILVLLGKIPEAMAWFEKTNVFDKLDVLSAFEISCLQGGQCTSLYGLSPQEAVDLSYDYIVSGSFEMALKFLKEYAKINRSAHPLVLFYQASAEHKLGLNCDITIEKALENAGIICFPSKLSDIVVLREINATHENYLVNYYLGNLYYDKKQYAEASIFWLKSEKLNPKFATVKRNLSLYYFNKEKNSAKAVRYMEAAYELDRTDGRILTELFQLYVLLGKTPNFLHRFLHDNLHVALERDDLYLEYVNAVNRCVSHTEAEKMMQARHFHPWEGGEGKVTKLYKSIKIGLADELCAEKKYTEAIVKLEEALRFPQNLGEGKLILDYDNDIHYKLGELCERSGQSERAGEHYRLATRGSTAVADNMYYNDSPVDYIFYIALASKKLGRNEVCGQIKKDFLKYYDNHINESPAIDYFAVSLPDMLIWERDLSVKNIEFCNYVKSLTEKI